MSKLNKVEELKTKRFVIRKSLIGKNVVISFTNKKQENVSYNHDEVYNTHSERFESMNCFQKYKSYTNSNCVPSFCRNVLWSDKITVGNCTINRFVCDFLSINSFIYQLITHFIHTCITITVSYTHLTLPTKA